MKMGVVDQTDVTDINNYITGGLVPVFNLWAADVNCDDTINILDITLLSSSISGTGTSPLNCCSPTIFGCTDILACNYNSIATIDDSSCIYLDISLSISNVSCNGGVDGSIVATATGGVLPFQYSLGAGLSQISGTFSNLSAGSYYVDVTDINGCTSNQTIIIIEPVLLESYDTLNTNTSVLWNGMNLNTSGDYSVTLGSVLGCDSIVNLNLTVTTTGILDRTENRINLVKITNMLGQETSYKRNTLLFYIYDNGTVEKKIIIE